MSSNFNLNAKTIDLIKAAFAEDRVVKIPLLKGGFFKAKLSEGGVEVDNLGNTPFLPWPVFSEAVDFLRKNGGRAIKGNAMNYKLGEEGLPFNSIEGYIAHKIYGKKKGDSIFRRITPIACILDWAGICGNRRGYLILKE